MRHLLVILDPLSILSPIGALMFAGTMRAIPWFVAYLVLMVVSGLLPESSMPTARLAPHVVMASYIMNIAGVSAIVFFLFIYFGKIIHIVQIAR